MHIAVLLFGATVVDVLVRVADQNWNREIKPIIRADLTQLLHQTLHIYKIYKIYTLKH